MSKNTEIQALCTDFKDLPVKLDDLAGNFKGLPEVFSLIKRTKSLHLLSNIFQGALKVQSSDYGLGIEHYVGDCKTDVGRLKTVFDAIEKTPTSASTAPEDRYYDLIDSRGSDYDVAAIIMRMLEHGKHFAKFTSFKEANREEIVANWIAQVDKAIRDLKPADKKPEGNAATQIVNSNGRGLQNVINGDRNNQNNYMGDVHQTPAKN